MVPLRQGRSDREEEGTVRSWWVPEKGKEGRSRGRAPRTACLPSHLGPGCPRMTGGGTRPFLAITLGPSRYHKSPHTDAPGTHPNIQEICLKIPVLFLLPFLLIQSPNHCIARRNVDLRQVLKKVVVSVRNMPHLGPNSLQNSLCTDFFKHKHVMLNAIPFQQIQETILASPGRAQPVSAGSVCALQVARTAGVWHGARGTWSWTRLPTCAANTL